jgi:ubiquinone/menaquinone biosynthesis C-methylase UbiE
MYEGRTPAPWVLDVATGTGRVPYYLLAEPAFHGRVVGLDASARMLALAREKVAPYRGRVALIRQTALALPFAADGFDAVTCLEALEFLPDAETAVREMARVLRPGGTLMITRRRGWEARTFLGRYLSAEAFEALLQRQGFVEIQTQAWQVEYDLVWAKRKDEGRRMKDEKTD